MRSLILAIAVVIAFPMSGFSQGFLGSTGLWPMGPGQAFSPFVGTGSSYGLGIRVAPTILWRQGNDDLPLAVVAFDPTTGLFANDLDLGVHAGLDGSISGRHGAVGIEVRGLWFNDWHTESQTNFGAPTLVRISTFVPFFLPGVTSVSGAYSSDLSGVEVNATHSLPFSCALIFGWRAFSLDEILSMTLAAVVLPTTMEVTTENSMSAFQVGCEITPVRVTESIFMNGSFKTGWGSNRIDSDVVLDAGIVRVSASGRDEKSMSFIELCIGVQ